MSIFTGRKTQAAASGLLMAATLLSAPAYSGEGGADEGRAIAEANCARCHAIGRSGVSPLVQAPPFRTLHNRYPVEDLAEALAEGIVVGHPEMPKFALEPFQVDALIAYLKSLEFKR